MALPGEVGEANKINGLRNRLGKNGFIVLQGFLRRPPKRNTGRWHFPGAAWALYNSHDKQIDPNLPTPMKYLGKHTSSQSDACNAGRAFDHHLRPPPTEQRTIAAHHDARFNHRLCHILFAAQWKKADARMYGTARILLCFLDQPSLLDDILIV
jgi:hypothetical protein